MWQCTHAHRQRWFYLTFEVKVVIVWRILEQETHNQFDSANQMVSGTFPHGFITIKQMKGTLQSQPYLFCSISNLLPGEKAAYKDLETYQECWKALFTGNEREKSKYRKRTVLYLWVLHCGTPASRSFLDLRPGFNSILLHFLVSISFPRTLIARIYLQ